MDIITDVLWNLPKKEVKEVDEYRNNLFSRL